MYERPHKMIEFCGGVLAKTGMHFRHLNDGALWRDEPVPALVLWQFADRAGAIAAHANFWDQREVLLDFGDGRIRKKRAQPLTIERNARIQKPLRSSVENNPRIDKFRAFDARHDADYRVIKGCFWHESPPVQNYEMMQAAALKNLRSLRGGNEDFRIRHLIPANRQESAKRWNG